MSDIIWKVDVSDEFLTFSQEDRPLDFLEKAVIQGDLGIDGIYCGNRGYYDTQFKLHRKLKSSDFYESNYKDEWGNFSLRLWRQAYGFGYAWEPGYYYEYKGQLYTTHINFR